jgi:hypothetical protein
MFRTGSQEAGLVETERARRTQPCRRVDELFAVLAHRGHRGMPTNPELACDLGDAVRVLTGPTAGQDVADTFVAVAAGLYTWGHERDR